MAIAAHPGDAFFAMGGPIALQAQLGAPSVFLSLTLGERGSSSMAPAQYGQLQRQAAERAAHLLAAEAVFLTYADGELPASEEAKLAVCDAIREHQPSAVVTHWKGSWHKDHRACFEIVNDAYSTPVCRQWSAESRLTPCASFSLPRTGRMPAGLRPIRMWT
jgi:LmbE family N-acetylglucosaminyl deacetylase